MGVIAERDYFLNMMEAAEAQITSSMELRLHMYDVSYYSLLSLKVHTVDSFTS